MSEEQKNVLKGWKDVNYKWIQKKLLEYPDDNLSKGMLKTVKDHFFWFLNKKQTAVHLTCFFLLYIKSKSIILDPQSWFP